MSKYFLRTGILATLILAVLTSVPFSGSATDCDCAYLQKQKACLTLEWGENGPSIKYLAGAQIQCRPGAGACAPVLCS